MTALAAVLSFGGRAADAQSLAAVLQAQAARGPDGERHLVDGPVALGERLLHPNAVPLPEWPLARQAIARLDRFILIWDGRLDNRDELIAALRGVGENLPREVAEDDRQLLLHLWRAFGTEVLPRLLGDFAFAIWDTEARELLLVRDAMGARPLYYTVQPGFFALASEDEALLALPGVSSDPAPDRLAYALFRGFTAFDWSQSWLREGRILMPGTSLRVRADGLHELATWWHWPVPEPHRFAADEEAIEAFGDVMQQAAADRTRDLNAIGLIASGGLDTAAVAVAAQASRAARPLRMFSAVQDPPGDCLETRAIEALAQTLSAGLHRLRLPALQGMADARDLADFHAQPHPVSATIPLIAMMCLGAARAGQRVLLHGATGDVAMYAPDDYLVRFAAERGWRAAWREAIAAQRHHTYRQGVSPLRQWARSAYDAVVPPAGKLAWREIRRVVREVLPTRDMQPPAELDALLRVRARQRLAMWRDERAAWKSPRTVHEHLACLFPIGVVRGLEGYERVAGRYGVELRDPWADRRVISFCLALPLHLRTREGWTKFIARKWVGRALPDVCVWRSDKSHLGHHLLDHAPSAAAALGRADPAVRARSEAERLVWRWALADGSTRADLSAIDVALLGWMMGAGPARAPGCSTPPGTCNDLIQSE